MKPAIDFGTDMLKLSATTFGQLIEIQLEDLATLVTHQSAIAEKAAAVHDMAGFVALQREYRETFWNDRLKALVAVHKTIQVAMERAGDGVRELTKADAPLAEAPIEAAIKAPIEAAIEAPIKAPNDAAMKTPIKTPKAVTPAKVTAPTTATAATKKPRKRKRAPR